MDASPFPRRTFLAGATALAATLPFATTAPAAAAEFAGENPLVLQRADAQIARHPDGTYFMTATVPEYDRLVVRGASTIAGLRTAAETVIWRRPASGDLGGYIWAPELQFLDGRWFLYFGAGRAGDPFRVRMQVMECRAADPRTTDWTPPTRITTAWDTFALDATVFEHRGVRYLAWAQSEPGISTNSNLYVSRMSSPATLTGPQVRLSVPTYAWETRGGVRVNEGPAVIIRNGRVFLSYSASAVDANYCLGLLTASDSADLLDPASWVKSPDPVFVTNPVTGQYGPGHNQFTTAPDGSDLLVYHARPYGPITGDPLFDPNRHTRVQKLYWNADGTPDFGIPLADGPLPVRLRSSNVAGRHVRHFEYRARLDSDVRPLADSQFQVVAGLAGAGTVSLRSVNFPDRYLRGRADATVWIDQPGDADFATQASFHPGPGLSGPGVSYQWAARNGAYLRHYAYLMTVGPPRTPLERADATYLLD